MIDILHSMSVDVDANNRLPGDHSYYPLFVDLNGRKVMVIGGGRVAERKVQALVAAGADVVLVSPELTDNIRRMADDNIIAVREREFRPGDLEDAWLVVSATDDAGTQKLVVEEAEYRRIFCNVVDIPDLCSFIVPSMVRRGDLCIAISTAGRSPAVAKRLRREMEDAYPVIWGLYLQLLGKLREFILTSSSSSEEKKRLCSALAEPDVLKWLTEDDWESIEQWAETVCGRGAGDTVEGVRSNA